MDPARVGGYPASCRLDPTPGSLDVLGLEGSIVGPRRQECPVTVDVLAEIMALLRTQGHLYGRIELTAPFGLEFPAGKGSASS
jgi:hypothetical protein